MRTCCFPRGGVASSTGRGAGWGLRRPDVWPQACVSSPFSVVLVSFSSVESPAFSRGMEDPRRHMSLRDSLQFLFRDNCSLASLRENSGAGCGAASTPLCQRPHAEGAQTPRAPRGGLLRDPEPPGVGSENAVHTPAVSSLSWVMRSEDDGLSRAPGGAGLRVLAGPVGGIATREQREARESGIQEEGPPVGTGRPPSLRG